MTPALIYLDHAATASPKAPGVAEAMLGVLRDAGGNPGRGGHRLAVAAARAVEGAREQVAELLGADPERTLLGSGCTYWLNLVLRGLLRPGDRVLVSALEHNAVMRPLRALQRELPLQVHVLDAAADDGVPTVTEALAAAAAIRPALVVLTHASNVSGAVLPVARIAAALAPTPVVVDAAQTAGSLPLDFAALGVAALACSGHKGLLGPPGTGVLLLAPGVSPRPLVLGGTGSRSESEEMPELLPDRLEAGTANTVGHVGLGAACGWLRQRSVAAVHEHAERLRLRALAALGEIAGVRTRAAAPGAPSVGVFSFVVDGWDSGELAAWLDRERGLLLRAGLHCAPAAHRRLGTFPTGTLRVGLGPLSQPSDVDALAEAVRAATAGRP